MNRVFLGLPRALQWEILTVFVGGFAVRFNRLRRFMTGDIQNLIMKHNFELHDISSRNLWAKNIVHSPIPFRLEYLVNRERRRVFVGEDGFPGFKMENSNIYQAIALTEFTRRETFAVLLKAKNTGMLSYGYYSWARDWYITPINDSIELPPFVKHYYPSYPYTNKKLGRPALKMKVYDPAGKAIVMSSWRYSEYRAWKEGREWWEEDEEEDDGRVALD